MLWLTIWPTSQTWAFCPESKVIHVCIFCVHTCVLAITLQLRSQNKLGLSFKAIGG